MWLISGASHSTPTGTSVRQHLLARMQSRLGPKFLSAKSHELCIAGSVNLLIVGNHGPGKSVYYMVASLEVCDVWKKDRRNLYWNQLEKEQQGLLHEQAMCQSPWDTATNG